MPIADATFVMTATKAMLSTGRFPKADDLWEELDKPNCKWPKWKNIYKRADRNAVVKRMASGNVEKFGGAASSSGIAGGSPGGNGNPPAGPPSALTLDELEGCFDSLAGAAMTNKDTVDELVKANATMNKAIATVTDTNARLTKKVEAQAVELQKCQLKGGGGGNAGGSPGGNKCSFCKNCKRTTWHLPDNCFELEKNNSKRPAYWKSAL